MKPHFIFLTLAVFAGMLWFGIFPVLASTIDGTIDATNRYAWSENVGWIDFGSSGGNVHVTDSALTGYAWGENIGWISLNCSNTSSCATVDYKVENTSAGTLSGYAWSENMGWIYFAPTAGGVTIDSSGTFSGYAWGENTGWISFNCANTSSCGAVSYYVSTDWRPASSRTPAPVVSVPPGSGGTFLPPPPTPISTPTLPTPPPTTPPPSPPPSPSVVTQVTETVTGLLPGFLHPKPKPPAPPVATAVPQETPAVFEKKWALLDPVSLKQFVLAPLPKEIVLLRQKFPELERTLSRVGISKITDVGKLRTVQLTLPGFTKTGGLTLPRGVPTTQLTPTVKEKLPREFVFVRSASGLIDVETKLSVDDKGKPQQKIRVVSGEALKLVVKPDGKTKSVKGYLVFKRKIPHQSLLEYDTRPLAAAILLTHPALAQKQEAPPEATEELVVLEFEYIDPDGDGIYVADLDTPIVDGEYEVITVLDYADPSRGTREMRLVTVIDPEGYLYEKIGNKEARIPNAAVTLLWQNPDTQQYEIWPAKEYEQQNPQTTDARGTYAFLVPEGKYRMRVEVSGYRAYEGDPFVAEEGEGIHANIELIPTFWWWKMLDWRTIALIAVALFLLYNFYRDRRRDKHASS